MDNILVVDDERNIRTLCARVLAGTRSKSTGSALAKRGSRRRTM